MYVSDRRNECGLQVDRRTAKESISTTTNAAAVDLTCMTANSLWETFRWVLPPLRLDMLAEAQPSGRPET